MSRSLVPATLLAATLLLPSAHANHSRHRPRVDTSNLGGTLRINDDSYCPGGRMWGREGRHEGRDDRIQARVVVRSTDRRNVRLYGTRGELVCRDARGRVVARQSFTIDGTFSRRPRVAERITLRPPTRPGRYRISVNLGRRGPRDSTTFLVAYDRDACPRRGRGRGHDHDHGDDHYPGCGHDDVVVRPRPRPRPRPQPAPVPGGDMGRFLRVDLDVDRRCGGRGRDEARVTVRNTHQFLPIRVEGVRVRGLDGLSSFRQVGLGFGLFVPDLVAPGQSAVFEATGRIRGEGGRATATVTNHRSARDTTRVKSCGWGDEPGWFDLH